MRVSSDFVAIPREYLSINVRDLDRLQLAMLLPSWRGPGICAIAVVKKLASIQNDFLEEYAKIRKLK